jgi:hypothetical protein
MAFPIAPFTAGMVDMSAPAVAFRADHEIRRARGLVGKPLALDAGAEMLAADQVYLQAYWAPQSTS